MREMIVPEVVRCPSDECKHAAGSEADDAGTAIENPLLGDPAEENPVLDSLLEPGQLDTRQRSERSGVGDPSAEGRRSMCVSFAVGEFAAEQVAQHAGDGHHSRRNAGFFDFSHCRLFPLEYRLPARFETIPSKPSSQALPNTSAPSATRCVVPE